MRLGGVFFSMSKINFVGEREFHTWLIILQVTFSVIYQSNHILVICRRRRVIIMKIVFNLIR